MPNPDTLRKDAIGHLADASSTIHELADSVLKGGNEFKSRRIAAIAVNVSQLQTELVDLLGHGRVIPERV